MKGMILGVALVCTGGSTCSTPHPERLYTLKMEDGTTLEACAYDHKFESAAGCVQLLDGYFNPKSMICGVKKLEFGLPTPPPLPENPRQ